MSDEPDNLVLVYLRRMDANIQSLREDMSEVKHRLTTLEIAVANLASTEMNHYVSVAMRLDRLETRMDRVERRLDIVPA